MITGAEGERPRTVVGVIDQFYNPYAWNIGDYVHLHARPFDYDGGGSSYLLRTEPGAPKPLPMRWSRRW